MVEDILKLKSFLLAPKRSDEFATWYYLDGWRMCKIKIGNKKGTVMPLFGKGKITLTIKALKEELKSIYWYAARCDASKLARENGLKKRKLQWERNYA